MKQKSLTQLRHILTERFSEGGLRRLCFDLDIDYDDLPGSGKADKAMELVAYLERRGRVSKLLEMGQQLRPDILWDELRTPIHIFISYKRNVDPDQKLAIYLFKFLISQDHTVFIDTTMRTGEAWLEEIDRQIKVCDFLVALLSRESADSEMVQAEITRAYEYRKLQGHPHTLPVRMAYEGLLPYSIDAFLNPLQYLVWQREADSERVGHEIMASIEGQLPNRMPVQITSLQVSTISEDGRPVADDGDLHPPLPEFDPRFLEELEAPGGAVKLRDKFYIERDADAHLKRQIVRSGAITTIRAPRQTGKSSLLVRGVHHAFQNGARIVNLDLQRVDQDHLETLDIFLRCLAEHVVHKLRFDVDEVEKA
jgi:hypothetical protein